MPSRLQENPFAGAILSHAVRKMQRSDTSADITDAFVEELLRNRELPTPAEQAENILLWLGANSKGPGHERQLVDERHGGLMGSLDDEGFDFVIRHLEARGLIKREGADPDFVLTFQGWTVYDALRRTTRESYTAFMAMPFGVPSILNAFENCFRPACRSAGFELVKLDEDPPAGSIDDRLRVEIRKARFLVADLTCDNSGAYWEAGFAEGLGKPVIYTCEQAFFKENETHFDTNHQQTILWSADSLGEARGRLTATIRATLPDVAKLED